MPPVNRATKASMLNGGAKTTLKTKRRALSYVKHESETVS